MNVSSIIIRAKRDDWENLLNEISGIDYTQVALDEQDKGLIIATIEAPSTQKDIQSLEQITKLKGVASADMHLTYNEEELKNCEIAMKDSAKIMELVDTKAIDDIMYSGDVNNFVETKF